MSSSGLEKKILLTGGSGFIGKTLLNHLNNLGYDIRLLSRKKIEGFENFIIDFSSDELKEEMLDSIDIVIHLAGYAHDLSSNPLKKSLHEDINTNLTTKLAKLATKCEVKKFIFISSVKAGGEPQRGIINTELNQTEPLTDYAISKRNAEINLLKIGLESDLDISIIRPALVYGVGVKGNLELMKRGVKAGWFPPLPHINNSRSLIHVDDLSRAIIFVMNSSRTSGEIYIATDSNHYSSREIYEYMCRLANKKIPSWSVPQFYFKMAGHISKNLRHKIDKLISDEHYSSEKLQSLGFKAEKTLDDMNKTIY